MITEETRQLSFEDIKPKRKQRYIEIINDLRNRNKTAKEIAVSLYRQGITNTEERNTTAPRLTELQKMGIVQVVEKKECVWSGKKVTVYKLTLKGKELLNANYQEK